MKQINLRVEDEIKSAFFRFCERQGIGPYEALVAMIRAWARAELLREKFEAKELDRAGALIELGRLVEDLQKVIRLNGEFRQAVAYAATPYQIGISELGL
jgi:hypothetical protein